MLHFHEELYFSWSTFPLIVSRQLQLSALLLTCLLNIYSLRKKVERYEI